MNKPNLRRQSPVYGASDNSRELLWLAPTAVLLLVAGASFLAFTSLPGEISGPRPPTVLRQSRRRVSPAESGETLNEREAELPMYDDEPQSEPWWLIAIAVMVVVGMGLLLIFYAQLPPFIG